MSNGDDEEAADESAEAEAAEGAGDVTADSLAERLDAAEEAITAAETEADLDEVEADLDGIEADLAAADLPEPDEDDEDADDPRADLEARLEDVRGALEEARGPYAEDVADDLRAAANRVEETRWTEAGEREVAEAVEAFLAAAGDHVADVVDDAGADGGEHVETLETVADDVADAGLDPDDDAETIEALAAAAEELSAGLDDAEEWDDLTVVEQLRAEGFYDRITPENRKDFPPELNVVRVAEAENDPERILTALDRFESDFMEENCLDALRRLGPAEAFEAMHERAQKRDQPAIEVLGKIADDRAVETLVEFIQDESNPPLQKVTLRALGEIGSAEATQDVANRLVAEDPEVRSHAARALGRIGDTRAVDPLADVLADDDADAVRAAAAWALVRIGTERALGAAAEYTEDRSYIVQHEAEKAAEALAADHDGADGGDGDDAGTTFADAEPAVVELDEDGDDEAAA